MKTIKKNVYYCDFCNKRGLAGWAISKHERKCTANPKRVCNLCGGSNIESEILELKKRFVLHELPPPTIENWEETTGRSHKVEWIGEPITMKEIREVAGDCPNCILAILRQTGMNRHYFEFKFDYKEEFRLAMIDYNEQRKESFYL